MRLRAYFRMMAAAASILTQAAVPSPAWADGEEDPNLDQLVDANQPLAGAVKTLDSGHVDLGPRFIDGRWTLLIHDDAAKQDRTASSVWRHPDRTPIQVLDQAAMTVPADPAYAFVGAAPGEPVWVVPQTQNPAVVWLGWNTQDPGVMAAIDRGVTLSLAAVQGPGTLTVYLQSGSFGEPQLLFDSRTTEPQSVWVDVNTHTHANWVFTAPGVYLAKLTVAADLIDGSQVTDTQVVRFAVGTATSPTAALDATWRDVSDDGGPVPQDAPATTAPGNGRIDSHGGGGTAGGDPEADSRADRAAIDEREDGTRASEIRFRPIALVAIVALVGILAAGAVAGAMRQRRTKASALASALAGSGNRTGGGAGGAGSVTSTPEIDP
jgi:surface-anchored protein